MSACARRFVCVSVLVCLLTGVVDAHGRTSRCDTLKIQERLGADASQENDVQVHEHARAATRPHPTLLSANALSASVANVLDSLGQMFAWHGGMFVMPSEEVRDSGETFTIPVVFHVIYNNADDNVSVAQVLSQLEVLNRDYNQRNTNFNRTVKGHLGVAGSAGVYFELASTDPEGNPTTGITRTFVETPSFPSPSDQNFNFQCQYSQRGGVDAWPTSKYLNVWVCPLSYSLGYSQHPYGPSATDGVVVATRAFGTLDKPATSQYNQGRTLTHEIGHWFDLDHPWGSGTGRSKPTVDGTEESGCFDGDEISDTPITTGPHYGCNLQTEECDGVTAMVQNFMDYSDDTCMTMFTKGQVAKMRALLLPGGFRRSVVMQWHSVETATAPFVSFVPFITATTILLLVLL